MLAEQQRIQKEKERIQKQIFKLPAGTIFCFQNGTHVKWYEKDGKRRQYLPKDQRKYAEKLAMKKYLLLLCLLALWGCEVGKFAPEREKLHGLHNGNDICAQILRAA